MLIEKECEFCHNKFMADSRELNRGNAKFCSLSCAAKSRNKNKLLKHCKCIMCNNVFYLLILKQSIVLKNVKVNIIGN